MATQVPGRLLAGQRLPLPVDQCLGPHDDARGAEAALQGPVGGEGRGVLLPLLTRQPLNGGDGHPLNPLHGRLAGHAGLSVQQDSAAATLPGRRAAILGRGHPQFVAEGGQ